LLENPINAPLTIQAIKVKAFQPGIKAVVDHKFDPPFTIPVCCITLNRLLASRRLTYIRGKNVKEAHELKT
jgi:hypothetical protein